MMGVPNKIMKNIYLVGFMGTGKTSVAKELAKKKKWRFADLDELIELKEKRSIADIFAKDGEPCFRRIEKKVLREVSIEKKFIIACGGGIVLDKENMKIMKETGVVICLTASAEAIINRTSGYLHRPLLNVADPKREIDLLLKLRAPFYCQADKVIDTTKISPKQAAQIILKITAKKK